MKSLYSINSISRPRVVSILLVLSLAFSLLLCLHTPGVEGKLKKRAKHTAPPPKAGKAQRVQAEKTGDANTRREQASTRTSATSSNDGKYIFRAAVRSLQERLPPTSRVSSQPCPPTALASHAAIMAHADAMWKDNTRRGLYHAIPCLLQYLSQVQKADLGRAPLESVWATLGEAFADLVRSRGSSDGGLGERLGDVPEYCWTQARQLTTADVTSVIWFDVLGPFPIGKGELDGGPPPVRAPGVGVRARVWP